MKTIISYIKNICNSYTKFLIWFWVVISIICVILGGFYQLFSKKVERKEFIDSEVQSQKIKMEITEFIHNKREYIFIISKDGVKQNCVSYSGLTYKPNCKYCI